MKKTYYSVAYRVWGANKPSEAWFDDSEKACEFANHNYRDKPVAHNVSKPEKIKEYDRLVTDTEIGFQLEL